MSASAAGPRDVGVFVAIQQMEYGGLASPYLTAVGPYSATGTPFSVAAGRISFSFGFKGPAVSSPTMFTHPATGNVFDYSLLVHMKL